MYLNCSAGSDSSHSGHSCVRRRHALLEDPMSGRLVAGFRRVRARLFRRSLKLGEGAAAGAVLSARPCITDAGGARGDREASGYL